jgi:predicted metal-dependent phosphoesterase TrpH
MIGDLHVHTTHSDGFLPTSQVLSLAARAGLRRVGIVDHDTTAGLAEALALADTYGVEVVPGIEVSARDRLGGRKAHVLGYYLSTPCRELEQFCAPVQAQRREAAAVILARLRSAGYPIGEPELARLVPPGGVAFKKHFLAALRSAGYGQENPEELDRRLFAEGGSRSLPGLAHVAIRYPDVREAVAAVREAGGVPVLAHPGLYGNFDLVADLLAAGLAGIEVSHPSHTAAQEALARELARRYGLVETGGSDFHGELDDGRHALGCRGIGEQEHRRLRERARSGRVAINRPSGAVPGLLSVDG